MWLTTIRAGVPKNEALVTVIVSSCIIRAPPSPPGPLRPWTVSRVTRSTTISVVLSSVMNTSKMWRAMGVTHTRRLLVDLCLGVDNHGFYLGDEILCPLVEGFVGCAKVCLRDVLFWSPKIRVLPKF